MIPMMSGTYDGQSRMAENKGQVGCKLINEDLGFVLSLNNRNFDN